MAAVRIRQIKPSFYLDKALWTQLRADAREFYVALWMLADDAGWFEWDATTIGASVYTFAPVGKRERDIQKYAAQLMSLEPNAPHLIVHPCGHAQVPKMPQHQRLSGPTKRVTTDLDRHERGKCPIPRTPATPRVPPQMPDTVGNGNGRERVDARERASDFRTLMTANGLEPTAVTPIARNRRQA